MSEFYTRRHFCDVFYAKEKAEEHICMQNILCIRSKNDVIRHKDNRNHFKSKCVKYYINCTDDDVLKMKSCLAPSLYYFCFAGGFSIVLDWRVSICKTQLTWSERERESESNPAEFLFCSFCLTVVDCFFFNCPELFIFKT